MYKYLTLATGCFLVRESETRAFDYTLSVRSPRKETKHIKINRRGGKFDVALDAKGFGSINQLVQHFQVCLNVYITSLKSANLMIYLSRSTPWPVTFQPWIQNS